MEIPGFKDILPLLEKIPGWKRITETPARVDELEKRLKALEETPKLPICQKCGLGYMRLDRQEDLKGAFAVFNDSGLSISVYKCDKCGFETKKSSE